MNEKRSKPQIGNGIAATKRAFNLLKNKRESLDILNVFYSSNFKNFDFKNFLLNNINSYDNINSCIKYYDIYTSHTI